MRPTLLGGVLLAALTSGCLMVPEAPDGDEADEGNGGGGGDGFSDPGDQPGDPASPDAGTTACDGGDDRMEHDGRCYLRFDTAQPWQTARATCIGLGFDLVSLETQAEADALAPLIGGAYVWIGLTDQASEGTFVWLSREPLAFTRWDSGQPDDAGATSGGGFGSGGHEVGEDCAKVLGASRAWNDEQCERLQPFVCER